MGRFEIRGSDAKYRDQVIQIYYPEESRNLGLDQLIEGFTIASILENNGHAITPEVLHAEESRILSRSQMPEALEKIRKIFGDDHEAWIRDYVLPTYAQRVIYFEFFLRDPRIHEDSRKIAENVLKTAENGDFSKSARAAGLRTVVLYAKQVPPTGWSLQNKKRGEGNGALTGATSDGERIHATWKKNGAAAENARVEAWLRLPEGKSAQLVDDGQSWMIVRPKKSGNEARFDVIEIPKASYDTWLSAQRQLIQIQRF